MDFVLVLWEGRGEKSSINTAQLETDETSDLVTVTLNLLLVAVRLDVFERSDAEIGNVKTHNLTIFNLHPRLFLLLLLLLLLRLLLLLLTLKTSPSMVKFLVSTRDAPP